MPSSVGGGDGIDLHIMEFTNSELNQLERVWIGLGYCAAPYGIYRMLGELAIGRKLSIDETVRAWQEVQKRIAARYPDEEASPTYASIQRTTW